MAAINLDEVFDQLAELSFADLMSVKTRFDKLLDERKQQKLAQLQEEAEQFGCSIVSNGKPKRRSRKQPEQA